MKKSISIIFISAVIISALGLTSCEKNDVKTYSELIIGTWKCTAQTGNTDFPPVGSEITFTKDGKLTVGVYTLNYSVSTKTEAIEKYGSKLEDYEFDGGLPDGICLFIDYGDECGAYPIKEMTKNKAVLADENETATFEKVK
ncbi:MAG: hypothetical protein LBN95_02805 [Prevotellaceae bacterium]|jgi:hypothetical protein|nr:hypothetical protein [Prevotellaceae bacterium]